MRPTFLAIGGAPDSLAKVLRGRPTPPARGAFTSSESYMTMELSLRRQLCRSIVSWFKARR
jgi:hypothetical protein